LLLRWNNFWCSSNSCSQRSFGISEVVPD